MNKDIFGFITGDIVDSTKTDADYRTVLQTTAQDIARFKASDFRLEFYRGDSFQSVITHPADGLVIMLLLKAGLRRHPIKEASNRAEDALDARMSLGIGNIKGEINQKKRLGEMDGTAFVRSGRSLESMKEENQSLHITTGNEDLDQEFSAVCPLLDAITNKWSINQAQAVYFYLLENSTHIDIGNKLGISQRGAGKRLDTSNVEQLLHYNQRYKNLIEWNYSK